MSARVVRLEGNQPDLLSDLGPISIESPEVSLRTSRLMSLAVAMTDTGTY